MNTSEQLQERISSVPGAAPSHRHGLAQRLCATCVPSIGRKITRRTHTRFARAEGRGQDGCRTCHGIVGPLEDGTLSGHPERLVHSAHDAISTWTA